MKSIEESRINHIMRLFRQRHVQAYYVGLFLQLFQRHLLNIRRCIAFRLVFIVGNNPAFKALQPLGEGTAHIATTYNANRATLDFHSAVGLALP